MPITLTFDARDAAPEPIREHLAEKDGKFIFEAEPASALAETSSKLKKLRQDLDAKSARLGKFAKLEEAGDDLDLDELLSLRELKKQGKPLSADEKAEIERLNKKAVDKLTSELNAEREARKNDLAQLKRFKLTDPIRAIATSEKVGMFAEDFELAWSEIGNRFKLVEEEGKKARIVVLDDDGDETDIKIEDFFTKLYQQKRPKFFKAAGAAGSGAQNNTAGRGNSKTVTRASLAQMSHGERATFFKDGGTVTD